MYWETGERSGKERAVAQLVEAARLDPREAVVFRYLGHYYSQIAGDLRRAARSYQKAITLDPEDAEAGVGYTNHDSLRAKYFAITTLVNLAYE